MADFEKVTRGLEACVCDSRLMQCANCPYQTDKSRCVTTLIRDALALLKEREAKPPIINENSYGWKFYYCPSCKKEFYQNHKFRFCEKCGQEVKWDE